MDRSKMTRRPSHPGELLRSGYMEPLKLSIEDLASRLKVPVNELEDFTNEKRSLSVDLAMRLAYAFGTTPEFWLNAQRNLDIWEARQGYQPWRQVEKIYSATEESETV